MESVLHKIESGQEPAIRSSLESFNTKNKSNFRLNESETIRKNFCSALLRHLSLSSPGSWVLETKTSALTALRILSREREGIGELTCTDGLRPIAEIAELSNSVKESCFSSRESVPANKVNAIVEAVKVLCNVVLNHHHLTPALAELGCLRTLALRLELASCFGLPHDVLFFDLRLLFLITASGVEERHKFRDDYNGIPILTNIIDMATVGAGITPAERKEEGEGKKGKEEQEERMKREGEEEEEEEEVVCPKVSCGRPFGLVQMRDSVLCLREVLRDDQCAVLSESLKIVFNQTVHWREEGEHSEEELVLCQHITHLIRIILVSTPPAFSKAYMDTVIHCIEVLVNLPLPCSSSLLLPPAVKLEPMLHQMSPRLYPKPAVSMATASAAECTAKEVQDGGELDVIFDDWNVAVIVTILALLRGKLSAGDYHCVATVISALRMLSKGHRTIRRFLKAQILPPLLEVKHRPEEGHSLKSRLIKLMTAGGAGGLEDVIGEFLFVLCKENASRLIKHAGYGNAAGLLMSRNLLGGGRSSGQDDYSSDSETSDTEEYERSKVDVDPITGGPSKPEEKKSVLEDMSEEEKEREAEKLQELLAKMERHGIIKMVPLDKFNRPIERKDSSSSSDDLD